MLWPLSRCVSIYDRIRQLFTGGMRELVVSETDIEAALKHLRSLPFSPPIPLSWDRQWLLIQIRDIVGVNRKIKQCFYVAPGVYAIINPFGVDLGGFKLNSGKLQVWLAIRSHGTDPNRITKL